jgi:tRNA (guanine6-N2)-methyltransferase
VSDLRATESPAEDVNRSWELDTVVEDRLLLESLPGALDYLAADLADATRRHEVTATVVRRFADALLVDWAGPLRPLAEIRFYSSCAVFLHDQAPDADVARDLDEWSRPSRTCGVLRAVEAGGPPRFRVGIDLDAARWPLRDHVEATWGWCNDPGGWQLNFRLHHDALVCEVGALYQTARFGRLARIPASTTPVVSAVLARLAKPESGQAVLDPFCGAGTNLITVAALQSDVRLLGSDLQGQALAAARQNLDRLSTTPSCLFRADARDLALDDASIDRVVANLPFGKRVGSHGVNVGLYPDFLRELTRILTTSGRAVLLTDDKRILVESIQRTANLRVIKEIQLATGGLHPSAYVLTRGRSGRGARKRRG